MLRLALIQNWQHHRPEAKSPSEFRILVDVCAILAVSMVLTVLVLYFAG